MDTICFRSGTIPRTDSRHGRYKGWWFARFSFGDFWDDEILIPRPLALAGQSVLLATRECMPAAGHCMSAHTPEVAGYRPEHRKLPRATHGNDATVQWNEAWSITELMTKSIIETKLVGHGRYRAASSLSCHDTMPCVDNKPMSSHGGGQCAGTLRHLRRSRAPFFWKSRSGSDTSKRRA